MVSIGAFVGFEFDGQLRLEDEERRVIEQEDYDVAPFVGLVLRSRFQ
jgi:hypothetical protein